MAKRLLLADDSQTIQRVVELVLGPEGFEVVAYGNGDEALKALESLMPDMILADIEMPGLNGYQLCEKVRSKARTQHIPVILLAGAFEPFDEDYMKSVGADDYILKPFESHELLSKVKSLLVQNEPPVYAEAALQHEEAAPAAENEWFEPHQFPVRQDSRLDTVKFDEELRESIRILEKDFKEEETHEPEAVSIEEISRMVKDAVGIPADSVKSVEDRPVQKEVVRPDTEMVEDIVRSSVEYMTPQLKKTVEEAVTKQITAILPGILEEGLRKALVDITGPLQGLINAEIKKVVPDLAERIIKREIEKITSELA
jgi:CheY-like chemotaxis protein